MNLPPDGGQFWWLGKTKLHIAQTNGVLVETHIISSTESVVAIGEVKPL